MAIYYVRASGGSNANDGLSFANGFATLAYAVNQGGSGNTALAAGDEIRLCADADHVLTAAFVPGTSGTAGVPITLTGANSTGTVDGTKPKIMPTTSSLAALLTNAASITDWDFKFLELEGRDTVGTKRANYTYNGDPVNTAARWFFYDCDFHHAITQNTRTRISTVYTRCRSYESGGDGFGLNGTSAIQTLINCEAYDNGDSGAEIDGGGATSGIFFSRFYRNGLYGIESANTAANVLATLVGNVCFDNGSGGLRINSPGGTSYAPIYNNSFVENGGAGLVLTNGSLSTAALVRSTLLGFRSNHAFGNTGGAATFDPSLLDWTELNEGNIEGDPLFADAANGDFTPTVGSPLIQAGVAGHDIGAVKYEPASGGGGFYASQSARMV